MVNGNTASTKRCLLLWKRAAVASSNPKGTAITNPNPNPAMLGEIQSREDCRDLLLP